MKRYLIIRQPQTSPFDEKWVIMVEHRSGPSTWLPDEILPEVYNSREEALQFDKVDYPLTYDSDPIKDQNEFRHSYLEQGHTETEYWQFMKEFLNG